MGGQGRGHRPAAAESAGRARPASSVAACAAGGALWSREGVLAGVGLMSPIHFALGWGKKGLGRKCPISLIQSSRFMNAISSAIPK